MKGLMLHCGAETTDLQCMRSMVHTSKGNRHYPIPFYDMASYTLERANAHFGMEGEAQWGINKVQGGSHFFGIIRYEDEDPRFRQVLGLRNSDTQALKAGLVSGLDAFVCDNLCFSGQDFQQVRKNTLRAWPDWKKIVDRCLSNYDVRTARLKEDIQLLEGVPCEETRGAEIIGVAEYEGVLRPQQAGVVRKEWRSPGSSLPLLGDGTQDPTVQKWEDAFGERSMWSLYNAMTEGLKRGAVASAIPRHTNAHTYMVNVANAA